LPVPGKFNRIAYDSQGWHGGTINKSKVALVRCESYDENAVSGAVAKGLDLLGGAARFVKSGEKIVLKPNVLLGSNPDACVTTHPAVFKAVGKLLQQAGAKIYYGDSASIGKCEGNMRRAQLKQVGDDMGFIIADFDAGRNAAHADALLVKSFTIANGVLDNDGLVSLPKLKTHGLSRLTGAIKNQFGCIPGLIKSQYHVKLPDPYDFSTMLVDINTLIKPRLYVMDGIMAMEGNGPRSGKPRKVNVLIFSTDPVAVDAMASRIINLNPEFVPTSRPGEESGLGTYHSERIELVGNSLESFIVPDFDVVRTAPMSCSSGGLMKFVKNQVCEKPVINKAKCTVCGTCVKMCPVEPKAVDWHSGDKTKPPSYKYGRCIRCFCCQEVCPEGAISIVKPMLANVISRS
jgi:uncharacterized protein (DUF362 family)/Pyruvate/2-oxoacid:ferredoxin oxidoreductase delta subunit